MSTVWSGAFEVLWWAALGLIVLGLPLLDRGRVEAAHAPLIEAVDRSPASVFAAPVPLGYEDDRLYHAVRSGLPLDIPNEHEVTVSICRRVRALATV